MGFENKLAGRTSNMAASVIRETLKVVAQPGMISLAGGIPSPDSFPVDIMEELTIAVLHKYKSSALQYGPTEGFPPLREAMVPYLKGLGVETDSGGVVVTSGSQGALDILGKILIGPGDKIALEAPTYLGALTAFNPYEPHYLCIETDREGIIPESLEEILSQNEVKFVYLVSNFQNPTGKTIPLSRRQQVAKIIEKYNALLVEDDPYRALRYRGEDIPPIKSLIPDHTVYLTTMSKVLAPGLRLGVTVAPELIQKWMVLAKQGVDLHTSSFDQALASEYISGGYIKKQLPKIIALYRPRMDAMLGALDEYFPEGFTWSRPEGGMFLWAEGPDGVDTEKIYWEAIKENVAFVPGKYFYAKKGMGNATMRLNFTMCDEQTIERGIRILAEVLKKSMITV